MTKVNYFQVTGSRNGADHQELVYARSKKEALELATENGVSASGIDCVKEMNFKTDMTTYDATELLGIRTEYKKLWKNLNDSKAVKSKARKAKDE